MSWISRYFRQQRGVQKPVLPASVIQLGDPLPLVHPEFPIAICWRHKAACTTVLKWFLFQTGLSKEAAAFSAWPHEYREQVLCVAPGYGELCAESLFGRNKFVVKVIRDPARRAVSGFLQVIRHSCDVEMSPWPDISAWKQSVGLGEQVGLTFHQFMRYVVDRRQADQLLDAHLSLQRCPTQDPHVEAFLPIENLTHELRNLERQFDLRPSPLAELSESVHHNPPTAGNRWRHRASHVVVTPALMQQLGTPTADVFLDEESLGLIAHAYAEDYAAYETFYAPRLEVAGHVRPRDRRKNLRLARNAGYLRAA